MARSLTISSFDKRDLLEYHLGALLDHWDKFYMDAGANMYWDAAMNYMHINNMHSADVIAEIFSSGNGWPALKDYYRIHLASLGYELADSQDIPIEFHEDAMSYAVVTAFMMHLEVHRSVHRTEYIRYTVRVMSDNLQILDTETI